MGTAIIPKRKKVIDIPEDVFRYLSIKAASKGQNLKKYIEDIVVKDVEDMDDSAVYAYLSKTKPEGKIMLNKQEKEDFEKFLKLNNK